MPSDDPLEGLRALHLPPETPSLTGDVGMAIAAGLAFALIAAALVRLLVRPKGSLRASAREALEAARSLPPDERRAAQAAVLRRVARTVEGDDAARATGPAWGATLDRVFATDLFGARGGRVFVDGLYARPDKSPADDAELDRELGGLVEKLKR